MLFLHHSNRQRVIKKIIIKRKLTTEESRIYAKQEFELHGIVSGHPNIVSLYHTRETDTDYEVFMEHANKGDYLGDKILEVSSK